ncbi:hypothetical protein ZIOFF_011678 [Zingiber officinale]|uniref:Fe2OG dioxygenase domain-containing protein n=1 Tax=Zingiber officinale TaxID=94328 RepID=A0A8J5HJK1_ZINOF|nr:hypothetical protein ZIOFF_011678 [Zingiber officinale]
MAGAGTSIADDFYDRLADLKAFDATKSGVQGLVTRRASEVPRIFQRISEHQHASGRIEMDHQAAVPVIDLAGSQREEAVAEIRRACQEWGFFQLVGHGVPPGAMENALVGVRAFHEGDPEVKAALYSRDGGRAAKYSSNFDLYASRVANWRDTLTCRMLPDPPKPEELPQSCSLNDSAKHTKCWNIGRTRKHVGPCKLGDSVMHIPVMDMKHLLLCSELVKHSVNASHSISYPHTDLPWRLSGFQTDPAMQEEPKEIIDDGEELCTTSAKGVQPNEDEKLSEDELLMADSVLKCQCGVFLSLVIDNRMNAFDFINLTTEKEALFEYSKHIGNLGHTLFELLSEALGLNPAHLEEMECNQGQILFCHYYPPCPEPEVAIGTSAHSDSGFLTVLLQDHIGGLQVLHNDKWVEVPPIPGALVINIADLLQLISNDRFKSVEHRVVAKREGPRISIACFFSTHFHPCSTRLYGPIKELISEENPPLYKEIMVIDYVAYYYSRGLDGKSTISHFRLS